MSRSKLTLSSCDLFGKTRHTIIVATSNGRVPMSIVLKTGSVCSIVGFHMTVARGGIPTLGITGTTPRIKTST